MFLFKFKILAALPLEGLASEGADSANLSSQGSDFNSLRRWRYLSGKCMRFQLSLKLDLDWGDGADTANFSCQGSDFDSLRRWRYLRGKCMGFQLSLKLDLDWGKLIA